jgi:hypothetical protein
VELVWSRIEDLVAGSGDGVERIRGVTPMCRLYVADVRKILRRYPASHFAPPFRLAPSNGPWQIIIIIDGEPWLNELGGDAAKINDATICFAADLLHLKSST